MGLHYLMGTVIHAGLSVGQSEGSMPARQPGKKVFEKGINFGARSGAEPVGDSRQPMRVRVFGAGLRTLEEGRCEG
jgi:hypothetical protein